MRHATLAILVLALAVLGGCATMSGSTPQPVDESAARSLMERGDFRGAAGQYRQLADDNRRSRDRLLLQAADALREDGDFDGVAEVLDDIKRKRLDQSSAAHFDLLSAEVALARGDAGGALALAAVPEQVLDARLRIRLAEVRARGLAATGRAMDSARERVLLDPLLEGPDRNANQNEILETLAGLEIEQLDDGLADLGDTDQMRPWLERALRLKGAVPASTIPHPTRQVGTLFTGPEGGTEREGYTATAGVALLLPLTGTLAPAGLAIRDGFLAAYFSDPEPRPTLRVFDSGDTTESALSAYHDALNAGAKRVVGPLAREQVTAIMSMPELAAPVLALNHPDNGAIPPQGSQHFGLLPDEEAAVIADHALGRGLGRAAILATTEEWSERAALAFRAQFEHGGGIVVGEARLAPEAVDYGTTIAQATGDGSADVIFLAVRPSQGRLLVPQLRTRDLTRLPMMATSHIYSGVSSRALDRDLNDVEFADSPWLFGLAAGLPPREALARKLPAAANSPRLFAFGMDAYRLLPYLDWLSGHDDAYLPGAIGQLAIDAFGRVRRLPVWLRFVDGIPQSAVGVLVPESGTTP
jgi:outer membrane PBP1 activator LpoA protein